MLPATQKSVAQKISTVPKSADAIACRVLGKTYDTRTGSPVVAIEDINFTVSAGEFVTVVGPSGCGKSTLLRLLGGLTRKTTGEMELAGSTINGPRRDVGIVFQSPTLLAWRTVHENIILPVDVLNLDRKSHSLRAKQLIAMTGLEGFETKYPSELSGGMQQRVAICRALVHSPKLLLMDEPFGALDALTRETMNDEMQRIWMETRQTILLITHSISEAIFLGDRVIVMTSRPGRIAEIVSINMQRPRTLEVTVSPQFGEYVSRIRRLLNAKILI
jgi:NitT/TauT family transport system ATP-binding protein